MTEKRNRLSSFLHSSWVILRPSLREMAFTPFYWIVAALLFSYALVAVWLLHGKDIPVQFFAYLNVVYRPVALAIFVLLYLGWPRGLREKLSRFYYKQHIVSGLILVLAAQIFHSIFLTYKMFYPTFVPFWADPLLSSLDQTIHFGKHPWEWIAPLFSNWFAIAFVDYIYAFWLFADLLMLLWQGLAPRLPEVRATFFLTYFMAWIILGTVFALIYSSAGPCYFDRVAPDVVNPYLAQMNFLRTIGGDSSLFVIDFQHQLWQNSIDNKRSLINGISAFPSMHVSIALIFALVGWHYGRFWRISTFIYFLVILSGSVALGWHYAVDGYFSIIVTLLLWKFNSMLVRRFSLCKPVKGF